MDLAKDRSSQSISNDLVSDLSADNLLDCLERGVKYLKTRPEVRKDQCLNLELIIKIGAQTFIPLYVKNKRFKYLQDQAKWVSNDGEELTALPFELNED